MLGRLIALGQPLRRDDKTSWANGELAQPTRRKPPPCVADTNRGRVNLLEDNPSWTEGSAKLRKGLAERGADEIGRRNVLPRVRRRIRCREQTPSRDADAPNSGPTTRGYLGHAL